MYNIPGDLNNLYTFWAEIPINKDFQWQGILNSICALCFQIDPRKLSKAVQVTPMRADAECYTDGPDELVKRSRTDNTSDLSVFSSESSDVDHDNSTD